MSRKRLLAWILLSLASLVLLAASAIGLYLWRMLDAMPKSEVVALSDHVVVLGAETIRFEPDRALHVHGMDSTLCFRLAEGLPATADPDVEHARLLGGAELRAILRGDDGDHAWTCGGWRVARDVDGSQRIDACLRSECSETPRRGTTIDRVEVTSTRPLRVLAVEWSSSNRFDHVAEPTPDTEATASVDYALLAEAYGGTPAWKGPAREVARLTLVRMADGEIRDSDYRGSLGLRLGAAALQLQPGPMARDMPVLTLPRAAIAACSTACWSRRAQETHLLLTDGLQLHFLDSPDLREWCWTQRLPMVGRDVSDGHLFSHEPVPPPADFAAQLQSREAYDEAARCGRR